MYYKELLKMYESKLQDTDVMHVYTNPATSTTMYANGSLIVPEYGYEREETSVTSPGGMIVHDFRDNNNSAHLPVDLTYKNYKTWYQDAFYRYNTLDQNDTGTHAAIDIYSLYPSAKTFDTELPDMKALIPIYSVLQGKVVKVNSRVNFIRPDGIATSSLHEVSTSHTRPTGGDPTGIYVQIASKAKLLYIDSNGTVRPKDTFMEFVYLHLMKRTVDLGATVKKGQIIGYMGNTGHAWQRHLHLHCRYYPQLMDGGRGTQPDNRLNPMMFFYDKLKEDNIYFGEKTNTGKLDLNDPRYIKYKHVVAAGYRTKSEPYTTVSMINNYTNKGTPVDKTMIQIKGLRDYKTLKDHLSKYIKL